MPILGGNAMGEKKGSVQEMGFCGVRDKMLLEMSHLSGDEYDAASKALIKHTHEECSQCSDYLRIGSE